MTTLIDSGGDGAEIEISLSIVSHGQGSLVRQLLLDIVELNLKKAEIILTLNIPECEQFIEAGRNLNLIILRNEVPQGYGANNNAAFSHSCGGVFCVLNPDLRLYCLDLKLLMNTLRCPSVGVFAPVVLCPDGAVQDSARKTPTITTMLNRFFFRSSALEYETGYEPIEADWVSGCFMMFKRTSFITANGFDETFFMYFEDNDLCDRVIKKGKLVMEIPSAKIIHLENSSSNKNFRSDVSNKI